jgi:hypothetical protein
MWFLFPWHSLPTLSSRTVRECIRVIWSHIIWCHLLGQWHISLIFTASKPSQSEFSSHVLCLFTHKALRGLTLFFCIYNKPHSVVDRGYQMYHQINCHQFIINGFRIEIIEPNFSWNYNIITFTDTRKLRNCLILCFNNHPACLYSMKLWSIQNIELNFLSTITVLGRMLKSRYS